MTRRRWIAEQWDETTATITGAQAEHMARVLRGQPGMQADVVAGGRVFHAQALSVLPDEVRFHLITEIDADPALPVTLLMSIFKFDRMEWALEKATELGVKAIVPVVAQRTEKHLAQAAERRVERWRRVVNEAAQQSRRSDVPLIHSPVALAAHIKQQDSHATRLVLAEQEQITTLREALIAALPAALPNPAENGTPVANAPPANNPSPTFEIAIGPEGGWTPDEAALFDVNGWTAVSLGPRILRAETAALAALAVVASFLE